MFSHPGKELKEHLKNVQILGLSIFDDRKTKWSEDKKIRELLEIILETHDYGKATKYFQEYIVDVENEKYKKSPYKDYKKHGLFSALWSYYLTFKKLEDEKLSSIAYMIVKKHHGDLGNFESINFTLSEDDKETFIKQIEKFGFSYFNLEGEEEKFKEFVYSLKGLKLKRMMKKVKETLDINDYILCNYLFSILISSDKGEAIFYDKGVDFSDLKELKEKRIKLNSDLVAVYKTEKFTTNSEVDRYREEIYQDIEDSILKTDLEENKIFSINVPTGTGKTLSSLNVALKLRERLGENNRIIYNLPFTSIIDQNFDVFKEVLGTLSEDSKVLIKHHYLADKEYSNEGEKYEYDISKYLIENWDSEIVVTTFVQFISSVFSNKNRKLKKYHNLANSIIILDEVQSIPYKYWEVLNKVMKSMAQNLNCYIILVTATMPLIFREDKGEILELAKYKKDYFSYFNRIDLDISMAREGKSIDEFNEIISMDIEENIEDSFLFVLNTIKSSLRVFEFLKEQFPRKDIIYLSTNIVPAERLKRIKKIKKSKECIVVATQLVEAGVDIDLDRVYRDFGPLDSINQVCGRCNRNGLKGKKGIVKLFSLIDIDNKKKEYFSYVYGNLLGNYTQNVFNDFDEVIEENKFYELSSKYFEKIYNGKSDDDANEIIKNISSLDYEKVKVELISNDFKTVDLFIDLDERASELWKEYVEIYSTNSFNRYEKQEKFNKIKKDFLSYVISVPEKFYLDGKGGFNLIEKSMLVQYYDVETGFKREDKQEDYFF